MKLITLNCNHCGAKLKVGDETKFVTCKHCDTQLAIHHEDGAAFTAVAEAAKRVEASAATIADHAEQLAEQNETLILQGELEQLDREWESRRQGLMTKTKGGQLVPTTRAQAILIGLMAPLVAVPILVPALSGARFELPGFLWLFVVAMMGGVLIAALYMHGKAVRYETALAQHEAERGALVAKLDRLRAREVAPARKRKKKRGATQEAT
jgi:hypothetical protein